MQIDFTSLNEVYHLAMIIVGMGGLIFAGITLLRTAPKGGKRKRK